MSHFTVAVFCKTKSKDHLEKLLAPFDEGISVPHYISKQELIDVEKKHIEAYRDNRYAEYLKDPQKYIAACTNEGHIKYISEEFPKKLLWTDEQLYQEAIKYEEPENIMGDGSVYSEYNPNSKWDWYEIGGRWHNALIENDVCRVGDLKDKSFVTYAVVTPDGKWHAPGEMGWFGMSSETDGEKSEWDKTYKKRFIDTADPSWYVFIVDCHI